MNVKEYQQLLKRKLSSIYNGNIIDTEWRTKLSKEKAYSPRIDVAIGPFAIEERFIEIYNQMYDNPKSIFFINKLYDYHCHNLGIIKDEEFIGKLKHFNENARCFMAIEIENKVSAKHLLGGIVNASALSRVGILVPWNPGIYRASKRMIQYFKFLKNVGKNTFDTKNVLILFKEQLITAVNAVTHPSISINIGLRHSPL